MKKLAIIGSGDLGQQIAHHARVCGRYTPVGFFDDFQAVGALRHGLPVMGGIQAVRDAFDRGEFEVLMVGIGYKHLEKRGAVFHQFQGVIPFATIIHPSVQLDESCSVGEGVFIFPGCVLDMNVVVKDNVLINAGCVIAHDSEVGENSFFGPGVRVAGFVKIGSSVNLGIGTVVIDNVAIASGVRTGGGAVVIDGISEPGLYVGLPAKYKKEN